jgi:uncharacterized protein YjbI with pentapeptide repeats
VNLNTILEKHRKWLANEWGGVRADLSSAYLTSANLTGADLSSANLTDANLYRADLKGAIFHANGILNKTLKDVRYLKYARNLSIFGLF